MAIKKFLAGPARVDMLIGDQLIGTANTLLESSISIGSSSEEVRGGDGARLFGKYFHTSTFDIALTDTMFKLDYLAFQTGSVVNQIADAFTAEEVVAASGGVCTVVGTPVAYASYGIIGWAAPAGTEEYQKVTFSGKTFTVSGAQQGEKYCVKYLKNSLTARTIQISSAFIPQEITLVMTVNEYKAGSGGSLNGSSKVGTVQVVVPRFQFSGSQEISLTSTGVANTPINGSALSVDSADCSGGGYYAEITEIPDTGNWYDNVFALAISDSDVDVVVNATQTLEVLAVPYGNGAAFAPPYTDLTFTSATPATATVGAQTGLVTGKAQGSTTVTVAITSKPTVSAVANVTVTTA